MTQLVGFSIFFILPLTLSDGHGELLLFGQIAFTTAAFSLPHSHTQTDIYAFGPSYVNELMWVATGGM